MNLLQIEKLREETPGCHNVLHFNNAGASLPPENVLKAVKNHLDLEASIGGYEAAEQATIEAENFYANAAKLINCSSEEIAFVDCATRAWDMAFYSLKLNKGDRIITAKCEYASNYLAFLHLEKNRGIHIDVINNDSSGQLDVAELANKIDNDVKLIAITHIPTQGGLVNPAEKIGKIANKAKIPYLLDTTQSLGQMPINVESIGCDFLCATGRKYLRGPRGTGFLYARKSIIDKCDPPFIDLHAAKWVSDNEYVIRPDARRFETWEQNISAKIGLAVAIEYLNKIGINPIWERIQFLATQLRENLSRISGVELQDLGEIKCGIVTFTVKNFSADEIKKQLSRYKINVSISLQEYARLDLGNRGISSLVRASVHYYNTEKEVEFFCEKLKAITTNS